MEIGVASINKYVQNVINKGSVYSYVYVANAVTGNIIQIDPNTQTQVDTFNAVPSNYTIYQIEASYDNQYIIAVAYLNTNHSLSAIFYVDLNTHETLMLDENLTIGNIKLTKANIIFAVNSTGTIYAWQLRYTNSASTIEIKSIGTYTLSAGGVNTINTNYYLDVHPNSDAVVVADYGNNYIYLVYDFTTQYNYNLTALNSFSSIPSPTALGLVPLQFNSSGQYFSLGYQSTNVTYPFGIALFDTYAMINSGNAMYKNQLVSAGGYIMSNAPTNTLNAFAGIDTANGLNYMYNLTYEPSATDILTAPQYELPSTNTYLGNYIPHTTDYCTMNSNNSISIWNSNINYVSNITYSDGANAITPAWLTVTRPEAVGQYIYNQPNGQVILRRIKYSKNINYYQTQTAVTTTSTTDTAITSLPFGISNTGIVKITATLIINNNTLGDGVLCKLWSGATSGALTNLLQQNGIIQEGLASNSHTITFSYIDVSNNLNAGSKLIYYTITYSAITGGTASATLSSFIVEELDTNI